MAAMLNSWLIMGHVSFITVSVLLYNIFVVLLFHFVLEDKVYI